ncbi:MAG: ribosome biogenesis GTPase Der, partial [Deltaproteobacteria bacterium]
MGVNKISMKPILAIVGRPNVGKSTLFNKIVRKRKALVDDLPGLTRDRIYGEANWNNRQFIVIDTGGFEPVSRNRLLQQMEEQVKLAIEEADVIIFLLDSKDGLNPSDLEITKALRRVKKPILYTVNKIDVKKNEEKLYDFYRLGVEKLFPISAEHRRGIGDLLDEAVNSFPDKEDSEEKQEMTRIAVIGRPNVGKSSLVNKILGFQRVLVDKDPGTTRDPIDTACKINNRPYLLIDTAGIRRKGKVSQRLEKYSIIKALKSIDRSEITLLMLDASQGIANQDIKVAGYAYQRGRACIIFVNKWDLIEESVEVKGKWAREIKYRFKYLSFAPIVFGSALTGEGVGEALDEVVKIDDEYRHRVPTALLNTALERALEKHKPPLYRNRQVKLYYLTQVSIRP